MRRKDSPTLKAWRGSTPPTPEVDSALWIEDDFDEDLDLSTRGEDARDKMVAAVEELRHPASAPVPELPPSGWPFPLGEDAYHGLAGEIVRNVAPYTEASPEAILVDLLASFGLMVGKGPYYPLGGSRQQPRLFILIVGETARGRKGAARGVGELLTQDADQVALLELDGTPQGLMPWTERHYLEGLTSGEGLAKAVEDTRDGRVLIVEEEFARLITSAAREGSTLSPLIRQAYDKNRLSVRNKNSSITADGAYVAVIGNITQGELMHALGGKSATETINGFGNRFLYIASRRTRLIPRTKVPDRLIEQATGDLKNALKRARRIEEMVLSGPAEKLWSEWYLGSHARDPGGLLGSMTARLDVHTLRVGMVYALLDGSKTIGSANMRAALEVVRYAQDSARYILGDSTGSAVADTILRALRLPVIDPAKLGDSKKVRGRMTRAELFDLFDRNIIADDLDNGVRALEQAGLVRVVKEATGGAPRRVVELIEEGR